MAGQGKSSGSLDDLISIEANTKLTRCELLPILEINFEGENGHETKCLLFEHQFVSSIFNAEYPNEKMAYFNMMLYKKLFTLNSRDFTSPICYDLIVRKKSPSSSSFSFSTDAIFLPPSVLTSKTSHDCGGCHKINKNGSGSSPAGESEWKERRVVLNDAACVGLVREGLDFLDLLGKKLTDRLPNSANAHAQIILTSHRISQYTGYGCRQCPVRVDLIFKLSLFSGRLFADLRWVVFKIEQGNGKGGEEEGYSDPIFTKNGVTLPFSDMYTLIEKWKHLLETSGSIDQEKACQQFYPSFYTLNPLWKRSAPFLTGTDGKRVERNRNGQPTSSAE